MTFKSFALLCALVLLCSLPSSGQTAHVCAAGADCTVSGNWTFSNPVVDNSTTVLRPSQFTGVDMCAKISAAFAFAVSSGWTSATVDARQRQWVGRQNCAGSPFAGASNNGTFTGVLLTQGSQIVTSVPIVIPGGILWDGSGPRSLVNPPRNFAGTSVQPSSTYAATYPLNLNPIIQYGATADTSSPQKIWLRNMAIGCLAPGAAYIAGTGSTGVYNGNGEEGSGGDHLDIMGCQIGIAVDVASTASGAHSGFDSSGFSHNAITTPADSAAVGIQFGNTAFGDPAGAIADVTGFEDNTITGTPSGTQSGTCVDIEGSMTYFKGTRCYYTAKGFVVGLTKTAVAIQIDSVDTEGNVSYPTTTIVELDSHAGYLINVSNVRAGGTTTNILTDANYPGGACTLLQSSEAGISLYSRGIGGGANGNVLSTARTACTTTGIFASLFGQNITWTGQHTFSQNVTIAATGTATSGANFSSKRMNYNASVWDGANPLNCSLGWDVTVGSGANPSETMTLEKCGTAASNNLNFNNLSTNGITFAPGTFKTNSGANTVQNGLNINSGRNVTATNVSNGNVTIDGNATGALTTTAAASDAVTVTGATSTSHCSVTPTNASAATNIATTFVSAKTTNQITVSHAATASMTYDVICTIN